MQTAQEKINKYKYLAEQIEYHINHNNLEKAKTLLSEYSSEISNSDTYAFQGIINFQEGKLEVAIEIFKKGVKEHPFNFSLHFNLAFIYGIVHRFDESFENYFYAIRYSLTEQEKENALNGLEEVSKLAVEERAYSQETLQVKIKELEAILQQADARVYPLDVNGVSMIRKPQHKDTPDEYMINMYKTLNVSDVNTQNRILFKSELIKGRVLQGEREWITTGPVVFPISKIDHNNPIDILVNNECYQFTRKHLPSNQYNYIRISEPGNIKITSKEAIFVGNPIELKPKEKPVKIVIKVFIDGLSQQFLEDVGLEVAMPNTYNFFNKGIIATNCSTVSEWTLPSKASINTGVYPSEHGILQPDHKFTIKDKTLAEYFKEQGYYCTSISGNWRTTPSLGYSKGYDRMIYQNFLGGFDAKEIIMEAIEHLNSFSDLNNFMGLTIMDLHNVPDEIESHLYSQVHTDIKNKINEKKRGTTSVQTKYDKNKIKKYLQEIKRVDKLLAILYDFVTKHYDQDEFSIVLHSDHGQSFLNNSFNLLGDHRVKIPFMMRGNCVEPQKTNELIESIDILPAMLYSSHLDVPKEINGILPKSLGGEYERGFTFSQVIHPNQPYKVRIKEKKISYYLETQNIVSPDLTIDMTNCISKIIDNFSNNDVTEHYIEKKEFYDLYVLNKVKKMLRWS